METEFKVMKGISAFKIVDHYGVVYGSYAAREDADHYCEMLNEKWANAKGSEA